MLKLLPYVAKNLLRSLRRTLLTILSVAVSLFLLAILFAVYASFYFTTASTDQAQRLINEAQGIAGAGDAQVLHRADCRD